MLRPFSNFFNFFNVLTFQRFITDMHFLPNQIIALDAFKNEKQINKKFCKEMTEVLAKKFNRSSVALDSDKLMKIFKRTHFTH